MQYKRVICIAVIAIAYCAAARHLLQTPAVDTSSLPEQCISGGLNLQSSCAGEIDNATKYFGLEGQNSSAAANISSNQVNSYLATAPPPSRACCLAACAFNAQLCSCDPGVLSLVSSFTGNNPSTYTSIALAFSSVCSFQPYINDTCPPNLATLPKPYGAPCPVA